MIFAIFTCLCLVVLSRMSARRDNYFLAVFGHIVVIQIFRFVAYYNYFTIFLYHQYIVLLYWMLITSLYLFYTRNCTKKWYNNPLTIRGNNFIDNDMVDKDLHHATTLYNMGNIGLIIAFNYVLLFQLLFEAALYLIISLFFSYFLISYIYMRLNIKTIEYLNSCALKTNYNDLLEMSNRDVDFKLFFKYVGNIFIKYTWITFFVISLIQIIIFFIMNNFNIIDLTELYVNEIVFIPKQEFIFYDGYIVFIPLIVLIIYQKFNDVVYKRWTIKIRSTVDRYIAKHD
jgi:hypothetical protein